MGIFADGEEARGLDNPFGQRIILSDGGFGRSISLVWRSDVSRDFRLSDKAKVVIGLSSFVAVECDNRPFFTCAVVIVDSVGRWFAAEPSSKVRAVELPLSFVLDSTRSVFPFSS